MAKRRRDAGFTLVEIMITVTVIGVLAMLAVPAWWRTQDNLRLKNATRQMANAMQYARSQAILSEGTMVVYFQAAAGVDVCGNAIPAPAVVLADNNGNCCIDAAEPLVSYLTNPADRVALNWGSNFAPGPPPEDSGLGTYTTGSTFTDPLGNQRQGVAFRPDGVPVAFNNACNMGQIGTGRGAIFLTNGRPDGGGGIAAGTAMRDVAVVLTPLGGTKVFSWNRSTSQWTQ